MRGQQANRKPGTKRQFNPQTIEAGDTITAPDKAWELRVLGVSQARRRYWASARELSTLKRKMTMVELEGLCAECGEMTVFWRALANISGLVRCHECVDARRRERARQKALKKAAEMARVKAAENALLLQSATPMRKGLEGSEAGAVSAVTGLGMDCSWTSRRY
jgi:hypothetical protein